MIRRDGESLLLEGALTLGTVHEVNGTVQDHLRQGVRIVDFRGITELDSAAVALALEWLRRAAESKVALRFVNLPAAMQNLAKLYGVSELLQPVSS